MTCEQFLHLSLSHLLSEASDIVNKQIEVIITQTVLIKAARANYTITRAVSMVIQFSLSWWFTTCGALRVLKIYKFQLLLDIAEYNINIITMHLV